MSAMATVADAALVTGLSINLLGLSSSTITFTVSALLIVVLVTVNSDLEIIFRLLSWRNSIGWDVNLTSFQ